ncbi:unnamed protein product, partial [Heterosigma akashiwo]
MDLDSSPQESPPKPGKKKRLVAYKWKSDKSCAVCGVASRHRCSKCKLTYYCSKRHQNFDWAMHKNRCEVSCALAADAGYRQGEELLQR